MGLTLKVHKRVQSRVDEVYESFYNLPDDVDEDYVDDLVDAVANGGGPAPSRQRCIARTYDINNDVTVYNVELVDEED